MSTFQRIVRDGVFDTLTTDQLTANNATIRKTLTVADIEATTVTATTVNATDVNATLVTTGQVILPVAELFIPDDNQVFGPDTGGNFLFQLTGHVVTAQLTLEVPDPGTVLNSNVVQFTIPAPYSPDVTDFFTVQPVSMCINGEGQFFGTAAFGSGVIQISPQLGSTFTASDIVAISGSTFTYFI